jgi:hypothetical protein
MNPSLDFSNARDPWLAVAGSLDQAWQVLVGVLAFRALPIVATICAARSYSVIARLLLLSACGAVAFSVRNETLSIHWLLAAYFYFAISAWTTHKLVDSFQSKIVTFAVAAVMYFLGPAMLLPSGASVFVILGWEFSLAAYSYHVEVRRSAERPSWRECMFFILVNPTLYYGNRGVAVSAPSFHGAGYLRVLGGSLVIFVAAALSQASHYRAAASSAATGNGILHVFITGALWLLAQYAAHSGLASLRIGLVRQLGYVLPERYRLPLFAKSPEEFWNRWNTYLGDWARMYIFYEFRPLLSRLSRRMRGAKAMRWASALAIVVTFFAIGVLHDAVILARGRSPAAFTQWFLVVGIIVVVWNALSRTLRGSRLAMQLSRTALLQGAVSRCCFIALAGLLAAQLAF